MAGAQEVRMVFPKVDRMINNPFNPLTSEGVQVLGTATEEFRSPRRCFQEIVERLTWINFFTALWFPARLIS